VRVSPASTPTTVGSQPDSYRWHSVTKSESLEITTIDAVADPKHHRYALHVHSSVGTASGGNVVISDGRWFSEDAHGVWCSAPKSDRLTVQANEDLVHSSIDPIAWMSKLHDGQSSPAFMVTPFLTFAVNPRQPLLAVVHRHGDTLEVTFQGGLAPREDVLTFSDFAHTPSVVVPTGTKPCPVHPSGD
jgi:hypothetical protein